jgi:Protein of unknown function (DUF3631)
MKPADLSRLQTWIIEIAATLLPSDTQFSDEGGERKYHGHGGLWINLLSGLWFSHAESKGGAALQLIAHLKKSSIADAIKWAEHWLAAHPGNGRCAAAHNDDGLASATIARDILERLVDTIGTPAELYLQSRAIVAPFPDCVKFLEHAQTGEGGIVGILTSRDRVVGVQVGYLDPDGRKTTLATKRRRFNLEKAPDAVFDIPSPGDNTEVLIAEGLENALTIFRYGARRCRVIGLPGIGTLQHLKFPAGTKATVFRDSDPEESPAAKALAAGLDALILNSGAAEVFVTLKAPDGHDANRLLLESGAEAIPLLIERAEPAVLSLSGEIQKLAQLNDLEYEKRRIKEAKRLGVRVGVLDEAVRKARLAAAAAASGASGGADWKDVTDDEDVDLCEILDSILTQIKRYVIAPAYTLAVVALWAAFTHLVHHKLIRIQVAARLAIQAKTHGCGKTVLLEILSDLVSNPRLSSSMTASTLLRSIEVNKPTPLLDEAHRILRRERGDDLVALCNASHRRKFAFVERTAQLPDGSFIVERFDIFCTMALAGIGELLPEQQDRSIVVRLDKVLAESVKEQLEDGTSVELEALHRKLEIWARKLQSLDRPPRPDCLAHQPGRVFDNWRPLIAIATLAGGQWPKLVQTAIAAALELERKLTIVERLLISIRKVFDTPTIDFQTGKPAEIQRIESKDLVDLLTSDPEEDWSQASRGRPITEYWLRDNLRGLLKPPKAQSWETNDKTPTGENKRVKHKGYLRSQFEGAWKVHLAGIDEGDDPPTYYHKPSGVSGGSGVNEQNQHDDRVYSSGVSGGSGVNEQNQHDDRVYSSGVETEHRVGDTQSITPDTPDATPDAKSIYPTKSTTPPDTPDTPDTLKAGVIGGTGYDVQPERPHEPESLRPGHPTAQDGSMDDARPKPPVAAPLADEISAPTPKAAAGGDAPRDQNLAGDARGGDGQLDPGGTSAPSPSSAASNGAATIADEARRVACDNPKWSVQRIAKELGQPASRIAGYLPDHQPKPRSERKAPNPDPLANGGDRGDTP